MIWWMEQILLLIEEGHLRAIKRIIIVLVTVLNIWRNRNSKWIQKNKWKRVEKQQVEIVIYFHNKLVIS